MSSFATASPRSSSTNGKLDLDPSLVCPLMAYTHALQNSIFDDGGKGFSEACNLCR